MYKQYFEAGFKIFGLYKVKEGACTCERPDCEAAGKHPINSNWQSTPDWDEDQIECMEMTGQFETGAGVLCMGRLIVDVDHRNGGCESFTQLCKDIGEDLLGDCGFAVATGSGNGSMHLYFDMPEGVSVVSGLKAYKGIDFKSSGFVVAAGSTHKSGGTYDVIHGDPSRLQEAPEALIELLKRTGTFATEYNGDGIEVTEAEIVQMLSYVDPGCDGDTWIKIGMALHHATNGNGFHIWDDWSRGDPVKYAKAKNIESRWHSLGKNHSSTPVTIGTLVHLATDGGYRSGATFLGGAEQVGRDPLSVAGMDLQRPPGFVGDVVKWMHDNNRNPRPNITVGAALVAVGNACGLTYKGDFGETANLMVTCVAGSGTGKDAVLDNMKLLHAAAGITPATHGAIKSEKEILSNLIEHQACLYQLDEIGIQLGKIMNAKASGASYNEGTIGKIMEIYTKAESTVGISGDTRRELAKHLAMEIAAARKAVDNNEDQSGRLQRQAERAQIRLDDLGHGIKKPFLSMAGFTTPETYDKLMTPDMVKNGFIARGMIFQDHETNPRANFDFEGRPMPTSMAMSMRALYAGGHCDIEQSRIEFPHDRLVIKTDQAARDLLRDVADKFYEYGEELKSSNGYEPIARRGFEMTLKISLILAVSAGLRTSEHVRWAYALVMRNCKEMIVKAMQNDEFNHMSDEQQRIGKIASLLPDGHVESEGKIINKCRKWKAEDVKQTLALMVKQGRIETTEEKHPKNNKLITTYWTAS